MCCIHYSRMGTRASKQLRGTWLLLGTLDDHPCVLPFLDWPTTWNVIAVAEGPSPSFHMLGKSEPEGDLEV